MYLLQEDVPQMARKFAEGSENLSIGNQLLISNAQYFTEHRTSFLAVHRVATLFLQTRIWAL